MYEKHNKKGLNFVLFMMRPKPVNLAWLLVNKVSLFQAFIQQAITKYVYFYQKFGGEINIPYYIISNDRYIYFENGSLKIPIYSCIN